MTRKYNSTARHRLFTVAIVMVLVFCASFLCSLNIERQAKHQLELNLQDVSAENALNIYNQVEDKHILLNSFVETMRQFDSVDDASMAHLKGILKSYNLKRIGYCDANGITHSTDGVTVDLSFRDFFKQGMKGKNDISEILSDAMDDSGSLINVMSIPLEREDGTIDGVVCITYDTVSFNDVLSGECFEGMGACFALNENGEIVVVYGNTKLALQDDFYYQHFKNVTVDYESRFKILKADNGLKSMGTINIDGETLLYRATPLKLMDGDVSWTVFTTIPKKLLDDRIHSIRRSLLLLNFIIISTLIVGLIIYLMITNAQRKTIQALAYEDEITGGPNYASFELTHSSRRSYSGSYVSINIRNFSYVNIALGSESGDNLLRRFWTIIEEFLTPEEHAARVKDDKFIIFMNATNREYIIDRLNELNESLSHCFTSKHIASVVPNMGIYIAKEKEDVASAFTKSQIALEQCKKNHNTTMFFYEDVDHEKLLRDNYLNNRFDEALANKEFQIWYQPKFSAATEEIVGAEALIRWKDNNGEMVLPGHFIPLFESNGRISELDEYVFTSVCDHILEWEASGKSVVPVSVNLSRASLFYSDICEKYTEIIKTKEINPKYLQLEITEGAIVGRNQILDILKSLQDIGIKILMDDFGTGYSSLATLNTGCFDVLKIDKSLVDNIGTESGDTLLHYVIEMGHRLKMSITAEGVELRTQLEFLKNEQCDDIQGFYFSRPLPKEEFEALITR